MKAIRIYHGPDKRCQFQDVAINYQADVRIGEEALLATVGEHCLMRRGTTFIAEFHVARWKRTWFLLEGRIDVLSTTGESRSMEPGDILFIEDLEGEGHVFRLKDGCDKWVAMIYTWADASRDAFNQVSADIVTAGPLR